MQITPDALTAEEMTAQQKLDAIAVAWRAVQPEFTNELIDAVKWTSAASAVTLTARYSHRRDRVEIFLDVGKLCRNSAVSAALVDIASDLTDASIRHAEALRILAA